MSDNTRRKVAKIQTDLTYKHEIESAHLTHKKKLLVRRLTIFFILFAVVSYFMISTLVSQAASLEKREAEEKKLQQELVELKNQQDILKEEIVKLNDDEYIAKLARRDYFLSESNEIIFNIPEEKKEKTTD